MRVSSSLPEGDGGMFARCCQILYGGASLTSIGGGGLLKFWQSVPQQVVEEKIKKHNFPLARHNKYWYIMGQSTRDSISSASLVKKTKDQKNG
jgi:hypothetical protein